MSDSIIFFAFAILSAILFKVLFEKLNCKFRLFEPIRMKIGNLSEKNKTILSLVIFVIIGIIVFGFMGETGEREKGIVFGILYSLREVCFGNNSEIPSDDTTVKEEK